ncbi:glycosyltransferase [Methanomicrobium antiquum]|uniref:Glycosyltransferase n=1 Tax=Methanomicrobium antiquum TaxID=487686 RepID=A0AAF0FW38_9EURY|nr:glycosyltransferase [Methanomicrobium antiquum]WFN37403.1 glycosyltransferase [Methanomicrobium antiquum]
MKKVIIITFYFSQKEIIASVRLRGIAKYLPEFGWDPTIITIKQTNDDKYLFDHNKYNLVETDYRDIYSFIKLFFGIDPNKTINESLNIQNGNHLSNLFGYLCQIINEFLCYPDREKSWYKDGLEAGIKSIENYDCEALISSSSPVTTHLIAHTLSEKYNLPWIADLRDLWTQNHYYLHSKIRRIIETRLEKKILKTADALSTVSDPLNNLLSKRYSEKKIFTIPNGFDPEKMNPGVPLSKVYTITYTGSIYKRWMDPEPLFKALSELIFEETINASEISINFYGRFDFWLEDKVAKYNLEDIVKFHGQVPHDVAIRKQWESQILLLLTWNNPEEKGIYTGKVFEYLAAKRPILSLGFSGGVVTRLITDTNAGFHVSNEYEIKNFLIKSYNEYKKNGFVQYNGIQSEIDKYSHYEMARKFSEALDVISLR